MAFAIVVNYQDDFENTLSRTYCSICYWTPTTTTGFHMSVPNGQALSHEYDDHDDHDDDDHDDHDDHDDDHDDHDDHDDGHDDDEGKP